MTINQASKQIRSTTIGWIDSQGEKTKVFSCPYKARSFYCKLFREGKNPEIVGAMR